MRLSSLLAVPLSWVCLRSSVAQRSQNPILSGSLWFVAVVFGLGPLVVASWQGRSAARIAPAA
jgi:hypothetical protein